MDKKRIAIFCSCAGYGTYVPSLAIKNELIENGAEVSVFIYESFFDDTQRRRLLNYRKQFHQDFRFAIMASNIAVGTAKDDQIELSKEDIDLLNTFDCYIVLYGLWLSVLNNMGLPFRKIICIRLDATDTPSWEKVKDLSQCYENIWLIGKNSLRPNYKLENSNNTNIRRPKIILHGGGWGVTNHIEILNCIPDKYELYVIYSTLEECSSTFKSFYMPIDWMPDKNNLEYPPLISFETKKLVDFKKICSNASAIISKPGGGTCLDALQFQIPLIYLQGMAKHEDENAAQLLSRGCSCSFEEWKDSGFSIKRLENIKVRIAQDMHDVKLLSHRLLWGDK